MAFALTVRASSRYGTFCFSLLRKSPGEPRVLRSSSDSNLIRKTVNTGALRPVIAFDSSIDAIIAFISGDDVASIFLAPYLVRCPVREGRISPELLPISFRCNVTVSSVNGFKRESFNTFTIQYIRVCISRSRDKLKSLYDGCEYFSLKCLRTVSGTRYKYWTRVSRKRTPLRCTRVLRFLKNREPFGYRDKG